MHLAFLNLRSTKEETNPSAPGQQILGLIGDKSDGSARLSNCDAAVSRRTKKPAPHPQSRVEDGREYEKVELTLKLNQAWVLKQSGGGGANVGTIRPNCDAATTLCGTPKT